MTLVTFVAITAVAFAIPAKRGVKRTLTLTNGNTVSAALAGDESFHYYVTADGNRIIQDADGRWQVVSDDVIQQKRRAMGERRNAHRKARMAKTRKMFTSARKAVRRGEAAVTSKKGLVILVNFQDKAFKSTSKQEYFEQMMNGEGDPFGENYGSVHEYFRDQSYGQFDLEFDVVGPVTVSNNMSYYGANDSNGDDKHPHVMVTEACKLIENQVNFADYDWDGDGEVDQVYVIYAGYGEASGAEDNTIWPHEYELVSAYYYDSSFSEYYKRENNTFSLVLDGVSINTYACGSELYGTSGSTIDGIGTMCHEFSHCLGLPDFYDTQYSGNLGMDSWDLMDAGAYNGDGYQPAGYTAYERWFSGWLEPVALYDPITVTGMPAIQDSAVAYLLMRSGEPNINSTYYLMYNHQQKGWDEASYGHGMLVQYVRYDADAWYNNEVNNSTQRMTLIPADGGFVYDSGDYYSLEGIAGDPWPGTSGNTSFSWCGHTVSNIAESNGLISFLFDGGNVIAMPVIDGTQSTHTSTSFTAVWSKVDEADSYNLRYREKVESSLVTLLTESFSKFVTTSENGTDRGSSINNYTETPGWTASMVYQSPNGVKMGSSKAVGYLTTPSLECASGTVTVLFNAISYKADNSSLKISIISGGEEVATQTVSDLNGEDNVITFTDVPESFSVKYATTAGKKRLFLSKAGVYDGEGTVDDIEAAGVKMMAKSSWTTINKITDTQYTVSSLTPNTIYEYQVQAVASDGSVSKWTQSAYVELSTVDVINTLAGVEKSSDGKVYDLSGRRISSATLPKGIYIVGGKKVVSR